MSAKVGRKQQSPIGDYFEHDYVSDKSKCLAVEGDVICGIFLRGKSNKVHLKTLHTKVHLAYLSKARENAKPSSPKTEANPGPGS